VVQVVVRDADAEGVLMDNAPNADFVYRSLDDTKCAHMSFRTMQCTLVDTSCSPHTTTLPLQSPGVGVACGDDAPVLPKAMLDTLADANRLLVRCLAQR
jgi:hypothetical protein